MLGWGECRIVTADCAGNGQPVFEKLVFADKTHIRFNFPISLAVRELLKGNCAEPTGDARE
jgi:hypothetical protein